jgi:hypothetical protein
MDQPHKKKKTNIIREQRRRIETCEEAIKHDITEETVVE